MAWFGAQRERGGRRPRGPVLAVEGLDVYYGRAHALQGVSLTLDAASWASSAATAWARPRCATRSPGWCRRAAASGSRARRSSAWRRTRSRKRGIAYVPQGRRVWPSLSVDETLRLVAGRRREVDRVYAMFPRLAERRGHGGAQLSGGEQQMLAIGRALLLNPRLLVMDEPTEGLAPVIVEQVAQALRELAAEGEIAVLLIEQNLGVAIVGGRPHRRDGQRPHRAARCRRPSWRPTASCRSGCSACAPAATTTKSRRLARRRQTSGRRRRRSSRPPRPRRRRAVARRPGAAARCAASRAGTPAAPPRRCADIAPPGAGGRRRARRTRRAATAREPSRRACRRVPGRGQQRRAPPTSPAPSTPRAASWPSCASASRSSACASSRSTCRPPASRRRPACIRARWRGTIRSGESAVFSGDRGTAVTRDGARLRALPRHAARPRRHHLAPAARAAPRWRPRRCARCPSACPR